MTVKTFFVNGESSRNQCYALHDDSGVLLIDPAGDFDLIDAFIQASEVHLKGIFLTHSHFDHSHLAEAFALKYDAPVFMHEKETTYYSFACTHLQPLPDEQPIEVGGFRVKPFLTPGHTAGSTCYLIGNHLFSGDTIFIEGVGQCSGAGSDVDAMYDSVQLIKNNLSRHTQIWPGHSYGIAAGKTMDFLLKKNIYFLLKKRADFIAFRMRKAVPRV